MDGFLISTASFARMPEPTKSAILAALGVGGVLPQAPIPREDGGDGTFLARMNDRQGRRLVQKLHPRSRKLLEAVAQLEPRFRVRDVLDAMGLQKYGELRGALSGLTRRTRSIMNDPDVWLFDEVQEGETPEDSIAAIHPETHAVLRRVLIAGE